MPDHPILFAGFNSAPNDGDEVDGAGYNEPVWPMLFEAFEGLQVVIVTEEMLEAFDTTCPDYIAEGENNVVTWPAENYATAVRNPWYGMALETQDNVVAFQMEKRALTVKPELDTAAVAQENQTETMRGKPGDLVLTGPRNVVDVPRAPAEVDIRTERDTATVRGDQNKTSISPESDTIAPPRGNRTETIRRKA